MNYFKFSFSIFTNAKNSSNWGYLKNYWANLYRMLMRNNFKQIRMFWINWFISLYQNRSERLRTPTADLRSRPKSTFLRKVDKMNCFVKSIGVMQKISFSWIFPPPIIFCSLPICLSVCLSFLLCLSVSFSVCLVVCMSLYVC